jgi:hypothetical protein
MHTKLELYGLLVYIFANLRARDMIRR